MNIISKVMGGLAGSRTTGETRRMSAEWNGVTLADSDKNDRRRGATTTSRLTR